VRCACCFTARFAPVSPVNENPTFGGNYTEAYDFPFACANQQWTTPGVSPATFAFSNISTPILPDEHTDLYAWSNFPAPYVTFDVYAAADPTGACSFTSVATTFSVQLCYFQNIPCSDTIGDNGDGWLYIGGTNQTDAAFGFQLVTSWNVTGSLYDMVVESNADYFVPSLFNSDDFTAVTGGTQFSYQVMRDAVVATRARLTHIRFCAQEFNTFDLEGYVIFSVNDGVVDRGIYARSLTFGPDCEIAFDFGFELSALSSATGGTYTWTVNGLFLQFSQFNDYDTATLSNIYVEVTNLPDASWYLTSWTITPSVTSDDGDGSVNVVLTFTQYTTVAGSTASLPPSTSHATVTVPATVSCPKSCSFLGNCQNNGTCDCFNGYISDAAVGCKPNVTITIAPVTGSTVPIKVGTGTTGATKTKIVGATMPTVTTKVGQTTKAGGPTKAGSTTKAGGATGTTKAGGAAKASATRSALSVVLCVVAALLAY
jgi:hypothetical protein